MLRIDNKQFNSRLLLGSAQYPSLKILGECIEKAEVEIITVALRRQLANRTPNFFWEFLKTLPCQLLPNTAGCYTAKEAITTATMARELFNTNWIKLEVVEDDITLAPNGMQLILATRELLSQGFIVFPYCTEDLSICSRLAALGCQILMPWAAPIGTARGVLNPYALQLLRKHFPKATLIVDAGIGQPSHALQVMEWGFDAILLNSAVSQAIDPVQMAKAFALAVKSGQMAFHAGIMPKRHVASSSTSLFNRAFLDGIRG